jgi:hypothetical protein
MATSNKRLIRKKMLALLKDELFTIDTELLNLKTNVNNALVEGLKVKNINLETIKEIREKVQGLQGSINDVNRSIHRFSLNKIDYGWHVLVEKEEDEDGDIENIVTSKHFLDKHLK